MQQRLSTGIERLDTALGGGLLPGSLTMLVGATGVGKTQLGLHFAEAGNRQEGRRGAIIDLSSRGDSQNHSGYTERLFDARLSSLNLADGQIPIGFPERRPPDVLPFLGYGGRRVLRSQMDPDDWHAWQSELNRRMPQLLHFVYGHLVQGTRRFIVDGIEPQQSAEDSLQLDLLELIYHRMLRKDHAWLARDVFRESFRRHEPQVAKHAYPSGQAAAVVLVTTKQTLLEQLMIEPLADGDLAAGANTVILLGRMLEQGQMKRGLYVAKHRGSFADSSILPFEIDEGGIRF